MSDGFADDRRDLALAHLGPMESELRKESTQRTTDGLDDVKPPEGLIPPPANLSALARLSQVNSTRRSIIEAVARNTVALGMEIEPKEQRPEMPKAQERVVEKPTPPPMLVVPEGGSTPPGVPDPAGSPAPTEPPEDPNAPPETETVQPTKEAKEAARLAQRAFDARKELDAAAAKDLISDSPTFLGLLSMVKSDEEDCGNGALEVSRDKQTGKVDGLFHVPGSRIRRNWDRDGYALVAEFDESNEEKIVRYATFGSRTEVDPDSGEVSWLDHTKLPGGKRGPAPNKSQNEILTFRLMNSESRDYGLPRDVAMIDDYVADRNASTTNVEFFGNSGVPPTIIFFNGEIDDTGPVVRITTPDDLTRKVAATLRAGEDSFQARVGLIPLPPGQKPTAVNLAQDSSRDMGYTTFRSDVVTRALMAFRVQPIFIAQPGENTGSVDPEVQRAITLEQVFDPEQGRYERRLTATVLAEMGYWDMELKLKRMAIEDAATARESSERSAEVGTITNGEFREAHGQTRLVEDGVRVPEGWNDELVKAKGAAGGTPNPTPRVNGAEDQRGQNPTTGGRVPRGTENPQHARNLSIAKEHADDHGTPTHVAQIAGLTASSIADMHAQRLDEAFPTR